MRDNLQKMNKARAPGAVFMHLKARSEGKCDMKLLHGYME